MFEPINLDDLSVDPIDYQTAAHTLRLLADYAERKGRAMAYRHSAHVSMARRMEQACEHIYAQLPDHAKW